MQNIANVINFARGCEPRCDDDSYLFPTLREELELCKRYGFCSTVLLQYDALIKPEYPALLQSGYDAEPGLWLEVVQPLAEAAGLTWRGRYVWDWDIRVNFLSAYTPDERVAMIDAAFAFFNKKARNSIAAQFRRVAEEFCKTIGNQLQVSALTGCFVSILEFIVGPAEHSCGIALRYTEHCVVTGIVIAAGNLIVRMAVAAPFDC